MARLAIFLAALTSACSHSPYTCAVDAQCRANNMTGTCEAQGFCSFPDTSCPSGSRFESDAGDGLGGTCVPEDNTATCGVVDKPCCSESACGGNTFCDAGMCKQCFVDFAPGRTHSCYLKHDGTIWCTGRNDDEQLGNASLSDIPTATPVQVRESTSVFVTDAIAIGMGANYSCAIRAGGTVWCWGEGQNCVDGGQLGDGSVDSSNVATQVIKDVGGGPLTNIVEVYGGDCHACARDSAGGVWCWGHNEGGRLGNGTTVSTDAAVPVLTAAGGSAFTGAVELVVGASHNCVRRAPDEVWCWGRNDDGQIGNNSTAVQPVPVKVPVAATSIAAGRFHTCAVKPDGTIACWGDGSHGRLGNGFGDRDDVTNQLSPAVVVTELGGPMLMGAARVAAGSVSCALMTNGDAQCWGVNVYGQTGTGVGSYVPAPVLREDGKPLRGVDRIVARYHRACAFVNTGELLCWGRNSEGQLGDGTFKNRGLATPTSLRCP